MLWFSVRVRAGPPLRMRDTSLAAYNYIVANGILGSRRMEVYETLFRYGPLTKNEVWKKLNSGRDGVHQRFSELRRMGAIQQKEKRVCSITGMLAYTWDVTPNIPGKIENKIQRRIWTVESDCSGLEPELFMVEQKANDFLAEALRFYPDAQVISWIESK